jgi:FkbM family methyltransferase
MFQTAAKLVSSTLGRESWLIRSARPAYESILDITHRQRGLPWMINGTEYRIDPRHRHRLGNEYDHSVAEFLQAHVRRGSLCFDLGANVGVYVLQLAHWSQPDGQVVAFEPNPIARTILEHHIRINGVANRVTIVPAAVGSGPGRATLYASGADGMSRLSCPNDAIADRVVEIEVNVVTVDEYTEHTGLIPDVLILDIEGFEIAALSGAKRLIQAKRDLLIVAEMHPQVWSSAHTTRQSALVLLDDLHLTPVPLEGQSDPLGDHAIVHLKQRERLQS